MQRIVELNFPLALHSLSICSEADEFITITSSPEAQRFFKKLRDRGMLPKHIKLTLSSGDILSVTDQYPDLNNSVDVVILGMGYGSNISQLKDTLRVINSWLKNGGLVFISFFNKDSITQMIGKGLIDRYSNIIPSADNSYSLFRYKRQNNEDFELPVFCKPYEYKKILNILSNYFNVSDTTSYPFVSTVGSGYLNDKHVRRHLRQVDKDLALSEKEKKEKHKSDFHGDLIYVIANKRQEPALITNAVVEYIEKMEYSKICEIIPHPVATDSWHLARRLKSQKMFTTSNLLKTVILRAENILTKDSANLFVITTIQENIDLLSFSKLDDVIENYCNIDFAMQDFVTEYYGDGCVSPIVALAQNEENEYRAFYSKNILDFDTVFFSAGNATRSVCIESKIFMELLDSINAIKITME